MDLNRTYVKRRGAQSRGLSASLRRLTARRAMPMLAAGALMLSAGTANAAPVTLTTGDLINTTSFNTAGHWSDGNAPSALNDYTVNGTSSAAIYALRTPPDALNYTFAGNSLTIGVFGNLTLKGTGGNVYTINNLILDGGTIGNGNGSTVQTIAGGLSLTANGGIFDSIDASRTIILTATVGGVGGLTKINAGTLTISGNNTYAGPTTLNGGTLSVGSNSNLGTAPAAATPNNIILNGGVLSANTSFTLNSNRGIGIGATTGATAVTGTLDVAAGQTLTYGGVIASAGNTAADILAKTGTGTLVLSGANTYTGGTLVNGGALQFANLGAIPATGSITINNAGALNAAGAYTTVSGWLGSGRILTTSTGAIGLTGDSAETIDLSSSPYAAIMLGSSVANANYTGTLTPNAATYRLGGGIGTLTLTNANTLTSTNALVVGANGSGGTVAVTNSNNYTGTTTVNGSTLQVGNGGTTGSLGMDNANPLTTAGGTGIVTANTGTVALNRSDNLTLAAGTVTGTGRFLKLGTDTLTMTGTGSLGSYFTSNGTMLVGTGTSLTSTSFTSIGLNPGDNATVTVNGTGSYIATGDFNVTDLSGSQATLNIADNAIVKANTLFVGKGGNSATNPTGIGTLGTVNQTGGAVSPNAGGNDWRIGGGNAGTSAAVGVYNISAGTLTTASNFQVGAYGNGTLNISGTAAVTLTGGFTDSGRFVGGVGNINVTGGSLNQNTNNKLIVGEQGIGTVTVGNGTANSGAVNLQGGLVMGLTATGTGTFNLNTGGTLTTPSISGTNNAVGTAAGAPLGIGTFNFNGGTLTVTASNGAGANGAYMAVTTANVQSGGAVINTNGNSVTITQPLLHSGAGTDGGLTKNGAGTLILSGADTYNGKTVVNAGQLSVTTIASLGSGNLLLPDNATNWVNLAFTGTENIAGLSFNLGGTFAPGGTYGAVGSGAANQFTAFSGTGILNVAAAPEPSQWAAFGLGVLGLSGLGLKARRRSAA